MSYFVGNSCALVGLTETYDRMHGTYNVIMKSHGVASGERGGQVVKTPTIILNNPV